MTIDLSNARMQEKLTVIYENDGRTFTASMTGCVITSGEATEWFKNQAMPAMGFMIPTPPDGEE